MWIASCGCEFHYKDEILVCYTVVPEELEYVIMGLKSVRYGRVHNLGNYETERLEAEFEIDRGQEPEEALRECKKFVQKQLGIGPSDDEIEAAKEILREEGYDVD